MQKAQLDAVSERVYNHDLVEQFYNKALVIGTINLLFEHYECVQQKKKLQSAFSALNTKVHIDRIVSKEYELADQIRKSLRAVEKKHGADAVTFCKSSMERVKKAKVIGRVDEGNISPLHTIIREEGSTLTSAQRSFLKRQEKKKSR